MAQASINIQMDDTLKRDFEQLCQDVGMSVSTAFSMFVKQSVRKKRLPLSLEGDPYRITDEEMSRRIAALDAGYRVEKTMEELEAMENE